MFFLIILKFLSVFDENYKDKDSVKECLGFWLWNFILNSSLFSCCIYTNSLAIILEWCVKYVRNLAYLTAMRTII